MARLTEQEQQDIIRFIEADKPLPDKYRFGVANLRISPDYNHPEPAVAHHSF